MEIRRARIHDREALIEMALENQRDLAYGHITVAPHRVEQTLRDLFEHNAGSHVLLVAEAQNGQLAGGLLACVQRYYFSDELQAQLIQWYVRRPFRGTSVAPRLVKAYVAWARTRGASEVFMGITSGQEMTLTHRMLTRLGFGHLGGNYGVKLRPRGAL